MRTSVSQELSDYIQHSLLGKSEQFWGDFFKLPSLEPLPENFVTKQIIFSVLWVWNRDLKDQKQTSTRSQQMEDVFSRIHRVTERRPGKAGASLFLSIQVNYDRGPEQKERSTWLQRMPAECHELRVWPPCITKTKYLAELTEIKIQNITGNQGCWLSPMWDFYPI